MLLEVENAVKHPISHCFDWIAGTSTGGILALGLAAGSVFSTLSISLLVRYI
jgi:calcium-independent phospholipase A2